MPYLVRRKSGDGEVPTNQHVLNFQYPPAIAQERHNKITMGVDNIPNNRSLPTDHTSLLDGSTGRNHSVKISEAMSESKIDAPALKIQDRSSKDNISRSQEPAVRMRTAHVSKMMGNQQAPPVLGKIQPLQQTSQQSVQMTSKLVLPARHTEVKIQQTPLTSQPPLQSRQTLLPSYSSTSTLPMSQPFYSKKDNKAIPNQEPLFYSKKDNKAILNQEPLEISKNHPNQNRYSRSIDGRESEAVLPAKRTHQTLDHAEKQKSKHIEVSSTGKVHAPRLDKIDVQEKDSINEASAKRSRRAVTLSQKMLANKDQLNTPTQKEQRFKIDSPSTDTSQQQPYDTSIPHDEQGHETRSERPRRNVTLTEKMRDIQDQTLSSNSKSPKIQQEKKMMKNQDGERTFELLEKQSKLFENRQDLKTSYHKSHGSQVTDVLNSGLNGVDPVVGMPIDYRDADFIWSSARITSVNSASTGSHPSFTVSVRYDGWGPQWDETVVWPNIRIAKIFTYSKVVKCLVQLIPKTKRSLAKAQKVTNSTDLWPCRVYFRMPHPGIPSQRTVAEELLSLESNILIQPYGITEGLLPKILTELFRGDSDAGRWMTTSILKPWTDNLTQLGLRHEKFDRVYQLATEDESTPGIMPPSALEKGSLLKLPFRVQSVGEYALPYGQLSVMSSHRMFPDVIVSNRTQAKDSTRSSPNNIDSPRSSHKSAVGSNKKTAVPPGVAIPDSLLHNDMKEIIPLPESNKFTLKVKVGENDVLFGEFSSKSHAAEAMRSLVASQVSNSGTSKGCARDAEESRVMHDIKSINPDVAIATWKTQAGDKRVDFSPRKWVNSEMNKVIQNPEEWTQLVASAFP